MNSLSPFEILLKLENSKKKLLLKPTKLTPRRMKMRKRKLTRKKKLRRKLPLLLPLPPLLPLQRKLKNLVVVLTLHSYLLT
jgi:hypothetical protein